MGHPTHLNKAHVPLGPVDLVISSKATDLNLFNQGLHTLEKSTATIDPGTSCPRFLVEVPLPPIEENSYLPREVGGRMSRVPSIKGPLLQLEDV